MMKLLKSYLPLLYFLFLVHSCTQPGPLEHPFTLTEASAADAGMSEERLQRIDAMLYEAIADEQIPGAVALVARHGKIVYHMAYGMAD